MEVPDSSSTQSDEGFVLVPAAFTLKNPKLPAALLEQIPVEADTDISAATRDDSEGDCDGDEDESFFFSSPTNNTKSTLEGIEAASPSSSNSSNAGDYNSPNPSLSPASMPPISPMAIRERAETTPSSRASLKSSAWPPPRDSSLTSKQQQRSESESAISKREAAEKDKDESKWISMLNSWSFTNMFRGPSLKRRIRRGIPPAIRPLAWQRIADVATMKRGVPDPRKLDTSSLTKQVLDDIEKDIDRTYPEHSLFNSESDGRGQLYLRSVLVWYASLDEEVGYCQGMSFIAGLILTYCTAEEGFYCFTHCMQAMRLRDIYKPGLVDLQRRLYTLTQLGWTHLEDLWEHLTRNKVDAMMFATEWFMTIFCRGFDFALSTRVTEIFMMEGFKILYRVALAILKCMKPQLMAGGFEEILGHIRNCNKTLDPSQILLTAFEFPIRSSDITKHEAAYDRVMQEEGGGRGR